VPFTAGECYGDCTSAKWPITKEWQVHFQRGQQSGTTCEIFVGLTLDLSKASGTLTQQLDAVEIQSAVVSRPGMLHMMRQSLHDAVGKKLDAADSCWRMEGSFLEVLRQRRDHVATTVCNGLENMSQAVRDAVGALREVVSEAV